MPFQIIRADITKVKCDAIVNAANSSLLGGGGVDGAIHAAAGPELLKECRALGGCKTGEAKLTGGYRLPCKYVIHTVGPVWPGDGSRNQLLAACYRNALTLAEEKGCETVAFPLISAGVYGFPADTALDIAENTIAEYLKNSDLTVILVLFDRSVLNAGEARFAEIRKYISDSEVETAIRADCRRPRRPEEFECNVPIPVPKPRNQSRSEKSRKRPVTVKPEAESSIRNEEREYSASYDMSGADSVDDILSGFLSVPRPAAPSMKVCSSASLEDVLKKEDESFTQRLFRLIDERGMKDSECYRASNIDRKLFSKIRSDINYQPKKPTVLAFAVGLKLSLEETEDLLMRAGFAFSPWPQFDRIVRYYITKGNYDIYEINNALFAHDQPLLGNNIA